MCFVGQIFYLLSLSTDKTQTVSNTSMLSSMSPLSLLLLLPPALLLACPEGDALHPVIDASGSGLGCLHFNVLAYFSQPEAVTYCSTLGPGGRLVEAHTPQQQEVLVTAIHQVGQRTWWNGAERVGSLSQWRWGGSGEDVSLDFGWGEGFPTLQPEDDCAFHYYGIGFQWRDAPCRDSYLAACQTEYL